MPVRTRIDNEIRLQVPEPPAGILTSTGSGFMGPPLRSNAPSPSQGSHSFEAIRKRKPSFDTRVAAMPLVDRDPIDGRVEEDVKNLFTFLKHRPRSC